MSSRMWVRGRNRLGVGWHPWSLSSTQEERGSIIGDGEVWVCGVGSKECHIEVLM